MMSVFNWKTATPTRAVQQTRYEFARAHEVFGDDPDPKGQVAALGRAVDYIAELEREVERLREVVKDAYHEGYDNGLNDASPFAMCDRKPRWDDSDAKDELKKGGE